jgi:hypothetical protein
MTGSIATRLLGFTCVRAQPGSKISQTELFQKNMGSTAWQPTKPLAGKYNLEVLESGREDPY